MREAIEISTNIGCKNNCSYCPQETIIKEYKKLSENKMMTLDTFKEKLQLEPVDKIVTFSGFSEPFLNPNTINMIQYTYDKGHPIQIYTTLIGLKTEYLSILKEIKFDSFTIHLPSIEENFYNIPHTRYLTLLELICINIKNIDFVYFKDIDEDIRYILAKYGYIPIKKTVVSRSGLVKPFNHIKGPGFCPLYINIPIILPSGDKALCCMDYRLKHINVTKKQINKLLRRYDSDVICRDCEFFIPYLSLRYPFHVFTELLKKIGFNYWEYINGIQRKD